MITHRRACTLYDVRRTWAEHAKQRSAHAHISLEITSKTDKPNRTEFILSIQSHSIGKSKYKTKFSVSTWNEFHFCSFRIWLLLSLGAAVFSFASCCSRLTRKFSVSLCTESNIIFIVVHFFSHSFIRSFVCVRHSDWNVCRFFLPSKKRDSIFWSISVHLYLSTSLTIFIVVGWHRSVHPFNWIRNLFSDIVVLWHLCIRARTHSGTNVPISYSIRHHFSLISFALSGLRLLVSREKGREQVFGNSMHIVKSQHDAMNNDNEQKEQYSTKTMINSFSLHCQLLCPGWLRTIFLFAPSPFVYVCLCVRFFHLEFIECAYSLLHKHTLALTQIDTLYTKQGKVHT